MSNYTAGMYSLLVGPVEWRKRVGVTHRPWRADSATVSHLAMSVRNSSNPARRPASPSVPWPRPRRRRLGGLLVVVQASLAILAGAQWSAAQAPQPARWSAAQAPQPVAPGATAPRGDAKAAAPLAGKWHADPMTVRWVIGSWSEACGPRPSGGGDPGGEVTIEELDGELVFQREGRRFSTEQCWQMHPALSRQHHSKSAGSWKTTCRSAPKDARQEILQTTVSVDGETISLQESGQYQFVAQGRTCAASSGRWQMYRRVSEAPPAPSPPPAPAVKSPCAEPGPPARIEVRPSRKLMRAGEAFRFRASVFDARGCSLGTPVAWELTPESPGTQVDGGRLTIAAGAPDAELSVTATAASQSVTVAVDVVSDERYAALLASGDFDADGASSQVATATITAGSLGARQGPSSPASSDRKWTFVGLVSAIALAFALIGVWLLRHARRGSVRPAVAPGRPLPDTGTVVFTGDDAMGEPPGKLDATRLEPAAAPAPKPVSVCPVCGTMYDNRGARACPKDGAQLLPINA